MHKHTGSAPSGRGPGKGVLLVVQKAKSKGPCDDAAGEDTDRDIDDAMDAPKRNPEAATETPVEERARDQVRKASQLLSNALNYLGVSSTK